jgi:hypothetical protein
MKRPRLGVRLRRAARVLTPDGFALAPLRVQFDADDFSGARQIVVISRGDM